MAELLKVAHQKLGYLKIVTPRRVGDELEEEEAGGTRRYVVQDGIVKELGGAGIDARGKAVSNWGAGNMDPDSVARHESLMRRFRFEDRAQPVKSPWDRGR